MRRTYAWIGLSVIALSMVAMERQAIAQDGRDLEMHAGYSKVLRFNRPISAVAIGNPEIADAVVSTDRSLVLTGKAAGATNLIVLDAAGGDIMNTMLVVMPSRQSAAVAVNSGKDLHGHHVYRCTPICNLVGKVTPPRSAPIADPTPAPQASARAGDAGAPAEAGSR